MVTDPKDLGVALYDADHIVVNIATLFDEPPTFLELCLRFEVNAVVGCYALFNLAENITALSEMGIDEDLVDPALEDMLDGDGEEDEVEIESHDTEGFRFEKGPVAGGKPYNRSRRLLRVQAMRDRFRRGTDDDNLDPHDRAVLQSKIPRHWDNGGSREDLVLVLPLSHGFASVLNLRDTHSRDLVTEVILAAREVSATLHRIDQLSRSIFQAQDALSADPLLGELLKARLLTVIVADMKEVAEAGSAGPQTDQQLRWITDLFVATDSFTDETAKVIEREVFHDSAAAKKKASAGRELAGILASPEHAEQLDALFAHAAAAPVDLWLNFSEILPKAITAISLCSTVADEFAEGHFLPILQDTVSRVAQSGPFLSPSDLPGADGGAPGQLDDESLLRYEELLDAWIVSASDPQLFTKKSAENNSLIGKVAKASSVGSKFVGGRSILAAMTIAVGPEILRRTAEGAFNSQRVSTFFFALVCDGLELTTDLDRSTFAAKLAKQNPLLVKGYIKAARTQIVARIGTSGFMSGRLISSLMLIGAFASLADLLQKDGLDRLERTLGAVSGVAGLTGGFIGITQQVRLAGGRTPLAWQSIASKWLGRSVGLIALMLAGKELWDAIEARQGSATAQAALGSISAGLLLISCFSAGPAAWPLIGVALAVQAISFGLAYAEKHLTHGTQFVFNKTTDSLRNGALDDLFDRNPALQSAFEYLDAKRRLTDFLPLSPASSWQNRLREQGLASPDIVALLHNKND